MPRLLKTVLLAMLLVRCVSGGETLLVGTNAEFPPFEFLAKDGRIVGFDIDLVKAVGRAAGFAVKVRNEPFDTLLDSLEKGDIHIVAAGMTVTEERRRQIAFSEPYYDAAQVIVILRNTPELATLEAIKDKRVAVQLGTTGAELAEGVMGKENERLRRFRRYSEAFNELKLGRVDCVVVDSPVAAAYLRIVPGLEISSPPMSEERFALGVAKNRPDLLEKVNRGLEQVRESGEYHRILEKWFGEWETREEAEAAAQ